MNCTGCGARVQFLSRALPFCPECVAHRFEKIWPMAQSIHRESRRVFKLPEIVPREKGGKTCTLCTNHCRILNGHTGFCGMRKNTGGTVTGGDRDGAYLTYYFDPLPTNCVADWVCPGGTGVGYPKYAIKKGPELGYKNMAVFYESCTFNCLFCQNWHYRKGPSGKLPLSAATLASLLDERTSCICYFGGDPTPHLNHALAAAEEAKKKNNGRILRICFETNGAMDREMLKKAAALSLSTGGCIKFDLKAFSEDLHMLLCGVSNKRTLENFAAVAKMINKRPEPPLLVASTLLVPGYISPSETGKIARFISSLNSSIPYVLLAFAPHFYLSDLPPTPRKLAEECLASAKKAGLKNVRLGNTHLLW